MAGRSQLVHALARELGNLTDTQVRAVYDSARWDLEWLDGPGETTMRQRLAPCAAARGLDVALFRLRRSESNAALAVQAIRFFRSTHAARSPSDRIAGRYTA